MDKPNRHVFSDGRLTQMRAAESDDRHFNASCAQLPVEHFSPHCS